MKKILAILLLTVCLTCTIVVPAFAATENNDVISSELPEESGNVPMPQDELTKLATSPSFTIVNKDVYAYTPLNINPSNFPTKTFYYTTNLTGTPGSEVHVGFVYYSPEADDFFMDEEVDGTEMGLRASSYGWPRLRRATYKPGVLNTSGKTVSGTVTWYSVDRLT